MCMDPEVRIFVEFNTGKAMRTFDMNACYSMLGKAKCLALPFFHAFTGADATCAFYSHIKGMWWSNWEQFPLKDLLTEAFCDLSFCPTQATLVKHQGVMVRFLAFAYTKSYEADLQNAADLGALRFSRFMTSPTTNLRAMMPAPGSYGLHIMRSAYQAGWVWGNTLEQRTPPPTEDWGWLIHEGKLYIQWTLSSNGPVMLSEVISVYKCRKALCKQCKCAKSNKPCLTFCGCNRKCTKT